MSINQDIRYTNPNTKNYNNPESLYDVVKPTRIITSNLNNTSPNPLLGENEWFIIDLDSGDMWHKQNGVWSLFYVFNNGTGGGDVNGALNTGGGYEWYQSKIGSSLIFRTLITDNSLIITQNLNDINITTPKYLLNVNTVGDGLSLFKQLVYNTVPDTTAEFKSIKAGTNINITEDANNIIINSAGGGSGGVSGARNIGSGVGLYAQNNASILEFKSLSSLTNSILITSTASNAHIESFNDYTFYRLSAAFTTAFNLQDTLYLLTTGLYINDYKRAATHWTISSSVGICYMTYNGPSNIRYQVNKYINAQVNNSLVSALQELDFVLVNGDDLNDIVPGSGLRLYYNIFIGDTVLQCGQTNSFIFEPVPNVRYTIGYLPRQVKGETQNLTIKGLTITITQV